MFSSPITGDLNRKETVSPRTLLCLTAANIVSFKPEELLKIPYHALERVFTKVIQQQEIDILHIRKELTNLKDHVRNSDKLTRLKNVLYLRIDRMLSAIKKVELELRSVCFISHDIIDTRKLMYVQIHRSCTQTIIGIYEEVRIIKAELSNLRRYSFSNPCLETFFRHLPY